VQAARPPIVVMGVSGSGKSTIARLLGDRLGVGFVDGDDLHPPANKAKMAAGIPLNDSDRWPWLEIVGRALADRQNGQAAIVVCSALKRRYRDVLRRAAPDAFFAHLSGSIEVLQARVSHRVHEYMPASLLASQVAALEPLGADESGMALDLALPADEIVEQILARLGVEGNR